MNEIEQEKLWNNYIEWISENVYYRDANVFPTIPQIIDDYLEQNKLTEIQEKMLRYKIMENDLEGYRANFECIIQMTLRDDEDQKFVNDYMELKEKYDYETKHNNMDMEFFE